MIGSDNAIEFCFSQFAERLNHVDGPSSSKVSVDRGIGSFTLRRRTLKIFPWGANSRIILIKDLPVGSPPCAHVPVDFRPWLSADGLDKLQVGVRYSLKSPNVKMSVAVAMVTYCLPSAVNVIGDA